jgi:hypothetical protein
MKLLGKPGENPLFSVRGFPGTSAVIPAKAGIQDCSAARAEISSGFPLSRE